MYSEEYIVARTTLLDALETRSLVPSLERRSGNCLVCSAPPILRAASSLQKLRRPSHQRLSSRRARHYAKNYSMHSADEESTPEMNASDL